MLKKKTITRKVFKKRPCRLCKGKIEAVDYKDAEFLGKFISDRGKIIPSRISGCCQKHQRLIANRIKRARIAGLLPFVKVKQGAQRERTSYSRR
ncbi:MAG: 30S ribosomal protein S18 [Candidatus Omnitrophica bacterium]|nr:30S ribosomal protein S18 [Candidatus Omnitrophota bacterium]MBU1127704.1 30S ribosomal protein S18 [Candidatus Omnitrophota bacterium]MBU1784257.1 30S ribosomal protein S18 [Candidatus Omnitrophota bacterium]MBU1851282.1 30S ribosomal protein S18 [Candidatus Omnitrophota bacterium]